MEVNTRLFRYQFVLYFLAKKEKNRKRKRGFSKETECLEMFRSESVPIGCKCRKLNDLRKIERKSPAFSEGFEKK